MFYAHDFNHTCVTIRDPKQIDTDQIFTQPFFPQFQLKRALVGHEFSIASHAGARPHIFGRGVEFIKECTGLRAFGSAALTLAYVASGNIDCYSIEMLKPWDIAAGALLIREAGGVVTGIDGGEYDILRPDIVAASSEKLGQRVVEIVRKVKEDVEGKQ